MTWAAFLAYFLIGAAWSIAMPYNGNADESEHIIRAFAVADGQVLQPPAVLPDGHPGAYFDVPRSLAPDDRFCMYFRYVDDYQRTEGTRQNASCLHLTEETASVNVWSWVGRYNPLYYLVSGTALLISPNMTGIIVARLITALVFAGLMAIAFSAAWRTGRPLMSLGIAGAATPSIAGLAGSVNPGALEVAAAIALWPLLYLLWTDAGALGERSYRRFLWLAVLAASTLALLRGLGVPLLLLGMVSLALFVGPRRVIRRMILDRVWRLPMAAVGLAVALATGWNWVSGNFVWHKWIGASDLSHLEALKAEVGYRLDDWLRQAIGQFGWGDTFLPTWTVVMWFVALALIAGPAALSAERKDLLLIIMVPVSAVGLLMALEHRYLHTLGMFAQYSRYVLPFAVVGLTMAGALRYPGEPRAASRLIRGVLPCFVICQLIALPIVMTRFQHGPDLRFGPLKGDWMPPLGPYLPLLLVMAGGAALLYAGVVMHPLSYGQLRAVPAVTARQPTAEVTRVH